MNVNPLVCLAIAFLATVVVAAVTFACIVAPSGGTYNRALTAKLHHARMTHPGHECWIAVKDTTQLYVSSSHKIVVCR